MTIIYSVHLGDRVIGRCDSNCHNAKGDVCHCCCGGGHHGIGSKAAVEDRKNISDLELIETCKLVYGPGIYRIGRTPEQLELFK